MKVGLFAVNMGPATPEHVATVARAAEDAGMESVWAGEHVVLPDPRVPPSPMRPDDPVLDPVVALTWAAAATSTLRLGTGIVILPQRNPVVLAKEVATLDVLSGGRVELGIGAGYLEPEFAAVGANFAERGAVTDEHLDALRSLWYDEHPAFHGRFVDFGGIDAHPRPVQRPLPIVVGGHSPAALRRARERGTGWYGFHLTPDAAAACIAGLGADHGLMVTVTPPGPLTHEDLDAYATLGVDRLVVLPGTSMASLGEGTATALRTIEQTMSVVAEH